MVTFIEIWQRLYFGESKYHMSSLKTYPEGEIDKFYMKLRDHFLTVIDSPAILPPIVKAAMIIQGLMNPESKNRKDGLPPVHTTELAKEHLVSCARTLRQSLYRDLLADKIKTLSLREAQKREKESQEKRQLEQKEFLEIHKGNARAFTYSEIRELNKSRPLGDQLSLTSGSHMLVHHCGYPACEYYLKNLSSESDLRNGGNSGLWSHLSGFLHPVNYLISGFHARCFTVLRSDRNISKENFVKRMLQEFAWHIKTKNLPEKEIIEDIEEVWGTWDRWGKSE